MRRITASRTDLGLIFVVLVWGFSPTLFKVVLQELDPLTFVFMRFLLLSALSVGVLAWRGAHGGRAWRISRHDIPLLVVSGLSGYGIYQLFYMVGLAHTTIFATALFAATVPLWSAVMLFLLRAERIHPVQWVGILISLGGVALFLLAAHSHTSEISVDRSLTSHDILIGDVLSLIAALLFAVYGIANKRLAPRFSPPELMCYTLLVGTLALAPFGIPALFHQHWERVTWHSWLILPYSVVFPIYITYSIWNWAIGKRGVGYVTLYNYAVPVLGGLIGWILLGEALTLPQVVGGALVLGGMFAARWGARHIHARAAVARADVLADADGSVASPLRQVAPVPLPLAQESETTPSEPLERDQSLQARR